MRALRWTGTVIVAALIAPAGSSARADELLVMPYGCTMVGGQPLLTRAPEQGHRIIGRREQRAFSACSPANPQMCRNWTVHRFDIDCEGTRVSWVDVVAAVSAEYGTGQAWSENGRLLLRMPRNWSFEPDDPCARPPGLEDRFLFGRMRRYCNDRTRLAPPVVEMPAGFAPMLGVDAIFVQSAPGPVASQAAPSPVPPAEAQAAAPVPSPPTKVTRAEPLPRPESAPQGRGEAPATPAPPKVEAPPHTQAAPQPPVPATKPVPAAPPAVQAAKPPQAAPLPIAPGGPVVPKIINRPDGGEPSVPPASAVPRQASSPPPDGPNAAPPAKDAAAPTPTPDPAAAAGRDGPAPVSLLSFVRSPAAGAVAALGGLAVVMVAAFAVARRRERIQAGSPVPHEFASVSLGGTPRDGLGPQPGSAPRRARPAAAALPVPSPQPPAQQPQAQAGMSPALVERIPQTRSEAIQMLGIGVSATANEQAMKKIVDGLRLAWHPDLARNDADRHLREFRIKQINAAWDLIQGRRMERLDS